MLIEIIKTMQTLAKSNPNSIFAVQSGNSSNKSDSPIFGFKRNIIGLIANSLFKNFDAQEYLRESGGLIALLDCTRIDKNNPFIMQWCIFAIRNVKNGTAATCLAPS